MSFDAWVVGFGLSRVLIELDLMESPWAYSIMAATMLIDSYLLYIFFTVRRSPSEELRLSSAGRARDDQSTPAERARSPDIEHRQEPFGLLATVLGYVIAALAAAMLIHTISPAIRLPP